MAERQPKQLKNLKDTVRNEVKAAGFYLGGLSLLPSVLLLSFRLRNRGGHDIDVRTLEQGSMHDALQEPNKAIPEWYIPPGATVEVTGLPKPVLLKDMKTYGIVFTGKKGSTVREKSGSSPFLDSGPPQNFNNGKTAPIADGLEAEFFRETREEVDEHYQ
ncbi:MAG TPA: hypothetical protein VLG67_02710 [Candidatus Saccharimonadales bacterium]|nr:hypothetical protein [Candidatus Saccharimonadales bacterium]